MAMGMSIMHAAKEARQGLEIEEIKAHMRDRLARTHILAALDTLEYVRRGGRIGTASALLGNMLSFKPIISVKDGVVVPVERPRTRNKAYERMAQLLRDSGKVEEIYLAESTGDVGEQLTQALKAVYPGAIPRYKLGSALGTHTGPGTAAITYITAS